MPVIMIARAAAALPGGSLVTVIATDPAARHDVPAWARMRGHTVVDDAAPASSPAGEIRLTVRLAVSRTSPSGQENEPPQAHALPAFGLSIVKPCFSIVSAKSIVAPSRYGTLIRSTITSTPS